MELGLTFNREGESVTLSLPFNVGGDASVETCSRSIDTLQDEALVAHDDPGAAVVVNHFTLCAVSDARDKKREKEYY